MNRRRRVALWLAAAAVGATAVVLTAGPAAAHGARSDSTETFYGCSDVVFDGGHGEVTGVGTTGPSPSPSGSSPGGPAPSASSSSSPPPGGSGGRCTATYSLASSWRGGFQATITVANPGSAPITGWNVGWNYAAGQTVNQGWNATVTQLGTAVSATNAAWNGTIPGGGNTSFGLIGAYTGSNPLPTPTCTAAGSIPPPSSSSPPSSPPSSPSPSASSSPPPATDCAGAAFCDGFESQTGSTVSGAWGLSYANCQGTGTATVDTAVKHSGTRSVRVDGKAGYCNHVLLKPTKDLSGLGSVWYGRFYVRHSTALPAAHVAFAALKDNGDGAKDLRIGGQNGALQWNRESDDATLPAQSPAGVAQSRPLPTGQWNCFEFMVDGRGTLSTWLDGAAVPGLTVDGVPTAEIDQQWLARTWRPQPADLRLGWESYGVGDDTLWFDDIAVGASRIGC
jgi:hypothetical protein